MSLEEQAREILDDFENVPSDRFVKVLIQIKPLLKNETVADYLQGKIQKILDAEDEAERKTQCKALIPYLDWYL